MNGLAEESRVKRQSSQLHGVSAPLIHRTGGQGYGGMVHENGRYWRHFGFVTVHPVPQCRAFFGGTPMREHVMVV
jgi:hypothetical protein